MNPDDVQNANYKLQNNRGLSLVELLLVIAILSILFGIAVVSIMNIKVITSNNTSTSVLVSDLKNQQVKAMNGDTEGRGSPDNYGVNIQPTKYVLFHGMTYNANDTANFAVPVESGFTLSTTFPNNTLLFASESGQLAGFVQNKNSITIVNTSSGQTKTIQLNKYGTVTAIN